MLVHGPNNVELINFFGFGTHIPGSIKKKGSILWPIFKCKTTVNSVDKDKFYTVFSVKFRCFIQMNLNNNQKYDIENPGIRCVEWTDAIKKK